MLISDIPKWDIEEDSGEMKRSLQQREMYAQPFE
jgi:hypothetical protein